MRFPPASTTRRSSSTISAASGAILAIDSRRSRRNEARTSSTRRRTDSSAAGASRISGSMGTKYGKAAPIGTPGYSGRRPPGPTFVAMTRFQKLALATAATTVALFTVGGLVRGTGSGLGCSSWPTCQAGRLFPTGTIHSLIEFSHRLLAFATAAFTACLLLVGTYVRSSGSPLVFTDWPLMHGRLVPTLGGAATAMFLHRVLAAVSLLLVLWLSIRARTLPGRPRDLTTLSTLALALFVAQVIVGAANVWTRLRPWAVVLHVALSVLIWATLVALATLARRRTEAPEPDGTEAGQEPIA